MFLKKKGMLSSRESIELQLGSEPTILSKQGILDAGCIHLACIVGYRAVKCALLLGEGG